MLDWRSGGEINLLPSFLIERTPADERFDTMGRSIALVNNPATLKDFPLASVSNLRSALVHLGKSVDADNDIVLLHITTHGSRDYRLAFDLPPLDLVQLTPTALARMLADSGIKWKVIGRASCRERV